jgi:hypothetical protein
MDAETPAWKQPFWYWIKWAKAWPFSVEALSGLFDFGDVGGATATTKMHSSR